MILFNEEKDLIEEKTVETSQQEESSISENNQEEAAPTKEVTRKEKEHFAKNDTKFTKKAPQKGTKQSRNTRNLGNRKQTEFEEKVIDIARVTTVVKGGRRFSFSAVVVIGNKKGKVGIGHGKANEVPDAIKKAIKNAQTNIIEVPIIDRSTIPHEVNAKFLSSRVLLKPAPKGKGIVASGTVRSVVELAGITDIYTKSYGSRTKQNAAKVTIKALKNLRTVEQLAELRGVSVEHILKK